MKRAIQLSLLTILLFAVMSTVSMAAPLLMFQVNSVDTTADTLLNHAILAHGHLDASPVPLAAGLYEFEVSVYSESMGGDSLWSSTLPLEVQEGGILHANIYGIPGSVFFENDSLGNLHMVTRYLKLELPSLEKSIARVPIVSTQNALSASRIYQFRLFEQWADHPTTSLPIDVQKKIQKFIEYRQGPEVVNNLVKEYVEQAIKIQELQNRINKLESASGKK